MSYEVEQNDLSTAYNSRMVAVVAETKKQTKAHMITIHTYGILEMTAQEDQEKQSWSIPKVLTSLNE
jgi:hypothetical protein